MGVITEDSVRKEVELYQESVYFFSGFKKVLEEAQVEVSVEKDFKVNDKKVRPDFYCESDEYITILEHKASLTENELGIEKECAAANEKYSPLIQEKLGDLGLIVPDNSCENLKHRVDLMDLDILVMGFLLSLEDEFIEIKTIGLEPKSGKISSVLNCRHTFEIDEFSFQKFIRHEPPPPYTASLLWTSLYQFIHLKKEDQDFFKVPYEKVNGVLKAIFASWIEGDQITQGRVNAALKLLDYAGWLEFSGEFKPIKVYPTRGTRSGDILIALIKKWVECKNDDDASTIKESDNGTVQSILDDYQ